MGPSSSTSKNWPSNKIIASKTMSVTVSAYQMTTRNKEHIDSLSAGTVLFLLIPILPIKKI